MWIINKMFYSPERERLIDVRIHSKFGVRHAQMTLCLFLILIGYAMRVNLSVAIVAMTDESASPNPDIPTYDWEDTGTILSSFFWGYVMLQVIAGLCAKRYGPKWFLVGSMLVNSLGCVLIPIFALNFGSTGVIFCRVLQGLSQGFIFPSVHYLLGQWAPVPERSTSGTIVYSGGALGTIISMPITGAIASSWAGWPASFYFFGVLGVLWTIFWILLGSNSPSEHKWISYDEKNYIETSLGHTQQCRKSTPWKSIFTSMPVWAIIVASFGQNWGYSTLQTNIPTYMSKIMKFDIKENGIVSAAPYAAVAVLSYIFGPVTDSLINRRILSRGSMRKLMNSIGTIVPAIALTVLGFVPDDQPHLSVGLLIIAVGINAAVFCGFQVNHIDLSPNYGGTLMGIGNGSSNIFSIISPLVVQALVDTPTDKTQWRVVFVIASVIYVLSDIFYVIFASGDLQDWNDQREPNKMTYINDNISSNKKVKL